jgi:hypothetical protein
MLKALGCHWLDPKRAIFRKPTFTVELLYRQGGADQFQWDATRERVDGYIKRRAAGEPLQVALRADYAHRQSLPPADNDDAVAEYVEWLQAIADDDVFGRCEWLVCGNEPNLAVENERMGQPMPAAWVARVVYGHGRPAEETDNAFQFVRSRNPRIQVLLPAIAPYSPEMWGSRGMPPFPDGDEVRPGWSPWESYQFDLFASAYDNNWHTPLGEVKSALHTYGRIGSDGTDNGGSDEPNRDVREDQYKAQFGTRWLGDALYLFRKAQNEIYGTEYDPWVLVTECNTWHPPDTPRLNYAAGWWNSAVNYVHGLPNVMGLAAFVDEDLDGSFGDMSMSSAEGHLPEWSADFDQLIRNGWPA